MRFLLSLLFITLLSGPVGAEQTFEADAALAAHASKRAEELVQFAAAQFDTKLDWSDDSIELLDAMLAELHQTYVDEQPADQEILTIAEAFGSYLGEVYRRNHAGTWGWISDGESVFPGMKQQKGGLFWPWAKSLDRIKTNNEPTMSDYYHYLVIR